MKNKVIRVITTLFVTALTARMGSYYNTETGFTEKYYNLPMKKVVAMADKAMDVKDLYWIREDGVKMYGYWVICASHPSIDRFTIIDTSLGEGIILDRHTVDDPDLIDIATTW